MKALLLLCVTFAVCACTDPKVAAKEVTVANQYAACEAKGNVIAHLALKCSERVSLLRALAHDDADCKAIFQGEDPGIACEDPNSYPPGFEPADAGSE